MKKTMGWLNKPSVGLRLFASGLLLAGSFLAMFSMPAAAQWASQPTDNDGRALPPSEAPCVPYNVGPSTGTTEALVRSSGPGYLSWVMLSSGAVTAFLVLKDTGSVNNTGISELGGQIAYGTTDTGKVMPITFRPPARFANGLTIKMSAATTWATVCTRLMGTQVP